MLSNGAILDTTTDKETLLRREPDSLQCLLCQSKLSIFWSGDAQVSKGRVFSTHEDARRRVSEGRTQGQTRRLNVNGHETHMGSMNTISYGDTVNGSVKPHQHENE